VEKSKKLIALFMMESAAKRKQDSSNHEMEAINSKKPRMEDFDEDFDAVEMEDEHLHHLEQKNWSRPVVAPFDPAKEALSAFNSLIFFITLVAVFQQLDCDYTTGDALPGMPGSAVGPVPIIRLWGVTEKGD
jgi:DNA polymerase delta subunit 1